MFFGLPNAKITAFTVLRLKQENPRALLGSMFLDISAVSGPTFLKPTLLPLVKLIHFTKSDKQFPSILQNN